MTLGQRIQELRKQNNFSQEQLAEEIVVSRQAISKWEVPEFIANDMSEFFTEITTK